MAHSLTNKLKSYFTPDVRNNLTKWEQQFISSMFRSKVELTDKQKAVLNKLVVKYQLKEQVVVERIVYLPTGTPEGYKHQQITTREYRRKQSIKRKSGYGKK